MASLKHIILALLLVSVSNVALAQVKDNRSINEMTKEQAAEFLDSPEGKFFAGMLYYEGSDVYEIKRDYFKAFWYFSQAADEGYADAQFMLGHCLQFGEGPVQKPELAVEWYRKAAEQGSDKAMVALAVMYIQGQDVPKDEAEALILLHKAADKGNEDAYILLGFAYQMGQGCKVDYKESAKWFVLSAIASNDKISQYQIGNYYEKGLGMPRNLTRAAYWYKQAADQGYAKAAERYNALISQGITPVK